MYNVDAILEFASKSLESIKGEQPVQEVMAYALTSLAASTLALAVMEPRGKHGPKADGEDSTEAQDLHGSEVSGRDSQETSRASEG